MKQIGRATPTTAMESIDKSPTIDKAQLGVPTATFMQATMSFAEEYLVLLI